MKRFILLFVMAVFTIMTVSSCSLICSIFCPSPHDRTVKIITKTSEAYGKRPYVEPWGKELNFLTDTDGVVWEIDQPVEFTIRFKVDNPKDFPFDDDTFTYKPDRDKSGPHALSVESGPFKDDYNPWDPKDPDDKERKYEYTLEVDGYVMDPVIIVWR